MAEYTLLTSKKAGGLRLIGFMWKREPRWFEFGAWLLFVEIYAFSLNGSFKVKFKNWWRIYRKTLRVFKANDGFGFDIIGARLYYEERLQEAHRPDDVWMANIMKHYYKHSRIING